MRPPSPPHSHEALCVKCGYVLNSPDLESRCSECGEPVRHSTNRFRLTSKVRDDASRAMVIGFLSLIPIPPVALFAIHLGVRSFKAARLHRAGRLASLMSIGAIALGLLGLGVFVTVLTELFDW